MRYAAGSQNATFTVAAEVPTITFTVANQTYGVAPITLAATSASSGAITYALVSGPASASGTTVTITGVGTVVLSATQGANGNYATGTQNATFTVAAEVPTISFALANQTYGVAPVTVAATSASAGVMTYALVSGPASVSGTTVTITGAGTVVLSATQAANGNYASGSQNATFTVAAEVPAINFSVANQTYGVAPITVTATSASAGAMTYALVSGPASVSGATVTITGAGTVVLSATQAANGNYAAAAQNTSFAVALGVPLLVFAPIAAQNTDSVPFLVSASSQSTGAITYAVVSGPATVAGSMVNLTGIGTVTLSASQIASGNYTSAVATVSFTVASGFVLSPSSGNSGSATTMPGGAASYSLALTTVSGTTTFPDVMTFTVSGLPTGAVATFSPSTIVAGSGPTTVTLTIQTSTSQASTHESPFPYGPVAPFIIGLLLPLLAPKRSRLRLRLAQCFPVLLLVSLGVVAALSGCGVPAHTSPPQSYTMVVTVTDATTGAHSSTNLTLTVQ